MKDLTLSFFSLLALSSVAHGETTPSFGLFAHPMVMTEEAFAMIYPLGLEVVAGISHLSASLGFSRMETAPLMIQDVSVFNKRYYRGSVLSLRAQYYSGDALMTGWLGEVGVHNVMAERLKCTDRYRCETGGYNAKNGIDATLDVGYGTSWDLGATRFKFGLFGLAGYRYQSLKTRSAPVDARLGVGVMM